MKRRLTVGNVGTALAEYSEEIASVGGKIQGKLGLKLLHEVKREPIGTGPYPDVTLFEAANRIMTDPALRVWVVGTASHQLFY